MSGICMQRFHEAQNFPTTTSVPGSKVFDLRQIAHILPEELPLSTSETQHSKK